MLPFLVLGCVVFPGSFFLGLKCLRGSFPRWSEADVALVSERFVSAVHALIATVSGYTIASSCKKDVMTESHWLVMAYLWLAIPYMVYDIYAMYYYHWCRACQEKGGCKKHSVSTVQSFLKSEFLLVLHHVILVTILFPIALFLRRGLGDFLVGCLLMTELSTPFLSLGKILIQFRLQSLLLYKVNGILILVSFFLCRILVFPYMYWVYGSQHDIPAYKVPFNIPFFCNMGNLLILAPQLYWFYLLCRKAMRLYHRTENPRKPATD